MNALRQPLELKQIEDFGFFSDFIESPDTTNKFTATLTDSGSAAITAGSNGGLVAIVPSDGTVADNDEAYLATKQSPFKPLAGQPIYAEALVQFTEANTNAANVFFGLMSSVGADSLVDNGGGPRASGTVVGIYKVDGGTVWRCVSRNGSTVTDSISTTTAGGANAQRLQVEIIDVTGSQATVVFRVDGNILRDANNQLIKHTLPLSGASACQLMAGAKNGSANNESFNVDYMGAWQVRAFGPSGI